MLAVQENGVAKKIDLTPVAPVGGVKIRELIIDNDTNNNDDLNAKNNEISKVKKMDEVNHENTSDNYNNGIDKSNKIFHQKGKINQVNDECSTTNKDINDGKNNQVSRQKDLMNEKIAFSIKVQSQLYKMDFSMLNIPIWNYDHFKIDFLGEGFYGTTYKAVYDPTNEVLVLKELKDYDDDNCINKFLDEIRLCCKLVHPNIIKTMGITFNYDGRVCCLLEYIPGGSLWDWIQTVSSDAYTSELWLIYLNISLDIARGMNYLHEQGVIHRDLNSKNVVMREVRHGRYEAIIIDFGLSYQKRDPTNQNDEEMPIGPCGHAFYIAPELFGENACGAKTDVFSFGIILCEMISGMAGADPDELPRSRDFGIDEKEFEELVHDCPTEFLNLAVRCCQVNPDYRPVFADIIKMVDIIIDRTIEQAFENTDVFITPRGDTDGDGHISNVSITSCSGDDAYILDACLLCSCRTQKKNNLLESKMDYLEVKTTYDRHGDVQRTSSRKLMQKFFRRCSYCGGRIFVSDELGSNQNTGDSATPEKQASSTNETLGVSIATSDVNGENEGTNKVEINDREVVDEGPNSPLNNRNKLNLTLDAPSFVFDNPSSPSPPVTDIQLPSPGILNTYTDMIPSPTGNNFYQASSILRQSNYEITTRTTQLAANTPGRLHNFFTNVIRRRKARRQRRDSEKRGSRLSLHKLFILSTSPKSYNPTQERRNQSNPVLRSLERQNSGEQTRSRFSFSRTGNSWRTDSSKRRQSTPLQLYGSKATTPVSPDKESRPSFQLGLTFDENSTVNRPISKTNQSISQPDFSRQSTPLLPNISKQRTDQSNPHPDYGSQSNHLQPDASKHRTDQSNAPPDSVRQSNPMLRNNPSKQRRPKSLIDIFLRRKNSNI